MRIICEKPATDGTLGICAYDIIGFQHCPREVNPYIICIMANGNQFLISSSAQNAKVELIRVVDALLSPSGVGDCRNIPGVKIVSVKRAAAHVLIDNPWAQSYVGGFGKDGDLLCLPVVTVR